MSLAEQFEVFVFDGDGVLYLDEYPLPGAVETVAHLRALGKSLRFVTNDPYPSSQAMSEKLVRMGFPFLPEEVFPVGRAVATYLSEQGIQRAYILGSTGFREELGRKGVSMTSGMAAEAVVLGYDRAMTLGDYQMAGQLIGEGALFVASNLDLSFPTRRGVIPASGSLVRALEMATGIRAQLIGKPSSYIFQFALRDLSGRSAVMVGDNPDSDIMGAHRFGIAGVLVRNGTTPLFPQGDYRRPDALISSLPELFSSQISLEIWENPGFPWPDRVVPAVAAIMFDSARRIFLIRRVDNGFWALPTGQVEPGESTEQAVVREVQEETGLMTRVVSLAGVYSDPRSMTLPSPQGDIVQYVTTSYLCEVTGGLLRCSSLEVREAGYFPVSMLPQPLVEVHRTWIRAAVEMI